MTQRYETEQEAAVAVAEARGWRQEECWSVRWASECQFWMDGDKEVVEVDDYLPFLPESIIAYMHQYSLNIKPVHRLIQGRTVRLWQVLSNGNYQKRFESPYMWDAVAQWLVGHYEFTAILKQKVDLL